jgi:quinol monooxygenase YgiN
MIKVLIERTLKPGCWDSFQAAIRQARLKADSVEGFIAGELLQDLSNPNETLVISAWKEERFWEQWLNSPEREKLNQTIADLLDGPERIKIYR